MKGLKGLNKLPPAARRGVIAALLVAGMLLLLYISGLFSLFVNEVNYGLEAARPTGIGFFDAIYNALFSSYGRGLLLFLITVSGTAVLFIFVKNKIHKPPVVDDRGVVYSNDGTYGTSGWLDEKEAKKQLEVCSVDKSRGIILGQLGEGGKVVALPENTELNRNFLIVGSPGKGKSYGFVRSAMLSAITREESVVVTDPSGELYESLSEEFRRNGYIVKLFNTVEPRLSDAWDCMSEVFDPDTGGLDDIRLADFVSSVIENTTKGRGDEFWGSGESNFFRAVTAYCAWNREETLKAQYKSELSKIITGSAAIDAAQAKLLHTRMDGLDTTIVERENILRYLWLEMDYSEEQAEECLRALRNKASQCDMSEVYYLIVNKSVADFEVMFKPVPVSHPACIAWSIFKGGKDGVRENFVQGLAIRLQLFQMRDIRRIITNKDIDLALPGEKKCAYFCKISDKTVTMAPITSLFFTFLFKNLSDAADRLGPKNRRYVNIILDEFPNIGLINSFDVLISTVRKRRLNVYICLQGISQLWRLYTRELADAIVTCCDTTVFLGCNDESTAKWASSRSGTASIVVTSVREPRGLGFRFSKAVQGYHENIGVGKREVLTPGEARTLGLRECIIFINGLNPMKLVKIPYTSHPLAKRGIPEVKVMDYVPASAKYALSEELDAFIKQDLDRRFYKPRKAATPSAPMDPELKRATEQANQLFAPAKPTKKKKTHKHDDNQMDLMDILCVTQPEKSEDVFDLPPPSGTSVPARTVVEEPAEEHTHILEVTLPEYYELD